MPTVSKRHRDRVMRCIVDFYSSSDGHSYISTEYIAQKRVLPDHVDLMQVINVLCAMGYITAEKNVFGAIAIKLKPEGECYFEINRDRRREKWLDRLYGFISGVVVTIIAELIVRLLAG